MCDVIYGRFPYLQTKQATCGPTLYTGVLQNETNFEFWKTNWNILFCPSTKKWRSAGLRLNQVTRRKVLSLFVNLGLLTKLIGHNQDRFLVKERISKSETWFVVSRCWNTKKDLLRRKGIEIDKGSKKKKALKVENE